MKETESEKKILDAAKKIFAEQGFSGARIDEIAQLAGINKAMIYYHYKSKKDLYHAVLDSFFKKDELEFIDSISNLSYFEKLMEAVKVILKKLEENHTERCALIAREMVSRGDSFQMLRDNYWIPDFNILIKLIQKGVESGEFPQNTPVHYVAFTILSHTVFYKINELTYKGTELYKDLYVGYPHGIYQYIRKLLQKLLLT